MVCGYYTEVAVDINMTTMMNMFGPKATKNRLSSGIFFNSDFFKQLSLFKDLSGSLGHDPQSGRKVCPHQELE